MIRGFIRSVGKLQRALTIACLVASVGTTANADVIYHYTGHDFVKFSALPYTQNDFVSITLELTSAVPANSTNIVLTPVAFSFSDGELTFTNTNSQFSGTVSTNNKGTFTSWLLSASATNYPNVSQDLSENDSKDVVDEGVFQFLLPGIPPGFGEISHDPGTWTSQVTPEPSTAALLAAGLACVSVLRRRNRPPRKSFAPAPR